MLVYPQIKNHFISMTGVTLAEHHNVLHVLSIGFDGLPESVVPHKSQHGCYGLLSSYARPIDTSFN